MKITVVGQGYVGLPLALAAAEAGFVVFGLDSDKEKIEKLLEGKSVIEDINDENITQYLKMNRYNPTTDPKSINNSDVVLICVPTPLDSNHKPDLTALIAATTTVGQNLASGTLVIVESTIEPGTCRNLLLPLLVNESKLSKSDFELAYSPERIDPTNKDWGIKNTPKLISGLTENAVNRADAFYMKFIDITYRCTSLEVAESAKLLENSFRFINISFINELSIFFSKIGINSIEVIRAAATKPYGFMSFYPSLGAGGHCIPVDPIYLAHGAGLVGAPTEFIELADKVNRHMPEYFISRAEQMLGEIRDKAILVVGVAYKPNVSDVRESPVESLILGLRAKGAKVLWHDEFVKEWKGEKSSELSDQYQLVIIATRHSYLDLTKIGKAKVLNTSNSNT
jgi:UDP-N-acetyl-D-glucosamine dehydrogenase